MTTAGVETTRALLADRGYIADAPLATVVHLALAMGRPLFLEGEPGTGKTEIAKALAAATGRRLVRLQCHDGLDLAAAAYEWDYARQLIAIRRAEAGGEAPDIYSRDFLLTRPLLSAIDPALPPAVLLIDELDRADEPFEAFLLELLGEFQLTIPQLGLIKAATPPIVILTSNRTREVHDAIRRRCLYHWMAFPSAARELAILRSRAPEIEARLAAEVVAFVQDVRGRDLYKPPGMAETIDWALALAMLGEIGLTEPAVAATIGVLLKYQDDIAALTAMGLGELVAAAVA
jgi:MoxR-like ATPase